MRRIKTIQTTDLETAREAAHFLILEESNTVAIVLAVVQDSAPWSRWPPRGTAFTIGLRGGARHGL